METWIVGGIAVLVTVVLFVWERSDRIRERSRDAAVAATQGAEIADLQHAQAAALQGIERATKAGIDPAAAHALGAAISIRLMRTTSRHPTIPSDDLWLVVENLGPGGAQIQDVTMVTATSTRFDPSELLPAGPAELLPGETLAAQVVPFVGSAWPLEFVVKWLDGSGAVRERTRVLGWPP